MYGRSPPRRCAFWSGTSSSLTSSCQTSDGDVAGEIFDTRTGSRWNVLRRAVEGALAGAQLGQVRSGNHFWFAWPIFEPETRVVTGGEGA